MSCVNTLEHFMQIERFYMSCNVGEKGFNGAGVNILNIQIPARMLRMFTPAPLNSIELSFGSNSSGLQATAVPYNAVIDAASK